jgi:hypothetical protein
VRGDPYGGGWATHDSTQEILMKKLLLALPFEGFYQSFIDACYDDQEEMEASNLATESLAYAHLGLDEGAVHHEIYRASDYAKAHQFLAREVVKEFSRRVKDRFDLKLDLQFESMDSPRFYNYDTDRIFAFIPLLQARQLLTRVRHTTLEATIKDRFTSRSGFLSSYSNCLETWLLKPLSEWDHNEVGTLLHALIAEEDDWDSELADTLSERGVIAEALGYAVDWKVLDQRLHLLAADPQSH